MATITTESQLHGQNAYPHAEDLKDRRCLLCDDPASLPFVYWRIAATDQWIVLCPECAQRFAWGLLRDSWEIEFGRREANIRYYTLGNLCGNLKPDTVIER